MTNKQISSWRGNVGWLAACLLFTVGAGCSNPRTNPGGNQAPPTATQNGGETREETVRLATPHEAGQRYRTTRTLRVQEKTASDELVINSEEVTLTRVLSVDASGRQLAVQRSWEASTTTVVANGGQPQRQSGELEGCTLELTQRSASVDARVLVGDLNPGGRKFLIEGFDAALLPIEPVTRGQSWALEGPQLAGLNALIEAMGFKLQRNSLTCAVTHLDDREVRISLDWRVTADHAGRPAVLRFTGTLVYSRPLRMVTRVDLDGGRLGADAISSDVELRVRRAPLQGWLDFSD